MELLEAGANRWCGRKVMGFGQFLQCPQRLPVSALQKLREEKGGDGRVTTFALKWHLLRVPQEYVSKTSHIQHKIVDVG